MVSSVIFPWFFWHPNHPNTQIKTDRPKRAHWLFLQEQKIQPDRLYRWKKSFCINLSSLFFHTLYPAGLSAFCLAVVVHHPFSSFPLVVRCPILHAIIVRCLRHPPLSSSGVAVVVVCRRWRPPPPWSAAAAVITTPCLRRLLPPALVHPICSLPPNLPCRCRLPLSLSAFAVVVSRRRLPPPQPSSPLLCLRRISPPTLVLPHCSLSPNHACRHHPPPMSSATVVVHRCRTSTCRPSNKMLIVAL